MGERTASTFPYEDFSFEAPVLNRAVGAAMSPIQYQKRLRLRLRIAVQPRIRPPFRSTSAETPSVYVTRCRLRSPLT